MIRIACERQKVPLVGEALQLAFQTPHVPFTGVGEQRLQRCAATGAVCHSCGAGAGGEVLIVPEVSKAIKPSISGI
eukprot:COSAG05_NODE_13536_length_426_cov_1.110092_1_plen_76_part_00